MPREIKHVETLGLIGRTVRPAGAFAVGVVVDAWPGDDVGEQADVVAVVRWEPLASFRSTRERWGGLVEVKG